ncbi:Lead, cadmium, zinc and mercury transporting ATPase; Copper-translocating P-type ATPase [hydrothermal vent metagenome]|uniref:Lead, cadmium, zinc and mercury transporting ATPase Copper-translocating P-type ATPase n=1 Tax=hydrothermal vent metagenome TaxID=652676 RepID=A0A3B1CRV3_9ZZZZ
MAIDQIIVIIVGLGLSVLVAWYFWFSEKKGVKIQSSDTGVQEAVIKVKGGYTPDVLIFEAGKPIKLNFIREETAACSEEVIFSDLGKKATLTPFKTIPVELKIDKPGEYNFQCGMGMLHGKLIIE